MTLGSMKIIIYRVYRVANAVHYRGIVWDE
jgi:hypothetical protein